MRDAVVQVEYRGPVTVGSPGRSRFHEQYGGMSDFIWNALGQAGWLGHIAKLHPLVEVLMYVPARPAPRRPSVVRFPLAPGGARRQGERGRVSEDGTVRKAYEGPLHARAAGPGVRLVESERRDEDFDGFEDLLYEGAIEAGWLAPKPHQATVAEIPLVEILIRIPRQCGVTI